MIHEHIGFSLKPRGELHKRHNRIISENDSYPFSSRNLTLILLQLPGKRKLVLYMITNPCQSILQIIRHGKRGGVEIFSDTPFCVNVSVNPFDLFSRER